MIQQTGFIPNQAQVNAAMSDTASPLTAQPNTSSNIFNFTAPASQQALTQPSLANNTSSLRQILESLQVLIQRLQSPASNAAEKIETAKPETAPEDYAAELAKSSPVFSNMTRSTIDFDTIVPGEGAGSPTQFFRDGTYNPIAKISDGYMLRKEREGVRAALNNSELTDLPFWRNNFESTDEMYRFLIAMGNLESAGGRTEENANDATGGDNGGSSGLFHLHNMYGFQPYSWGGEPVNMAGYEAGIHTTDFEAYTELVMRNLNANYLQSRHTINNEEFDDIRENRAPNTINEREILSATLGIWWTGDEENTLAGDYYLEALSNFKGVEDNTGAGFTLRNRSDLTGGRINDNNNRPIRLPDGYGEYTRTVAE